MLGHGLPLTSVPLVLFRSSRKEIVEDRHHRGVLAAHRRKGQAHVVVGAPADRDPLAVEGMSGCDRPASFSTSLPMGRAASAGLALGQENVAPQPDAGRKPFGTRARNHRDVVPAAVLVGELDQLRRSFRERRALAATIDCTTSGSTMSVRPSEHRR